MRARDGVYLGALRFGSYQVPAFATDRTAAWAEVGIAIRPLGKRARVIEPALPDRYGVSELPALAWSPDGRWLAFDVEYQPPDTSHADAEPGGVFVMHRSGRSVRRVAARGFASATWSPDGRQIAVRDVVRDRISIIDVQTGKRIRDLSIQSAEDLAWSPRAELIAFDNGKNLFLMRPDGGGLKRLTVSRGASGWQGGAVWSPNGKRIAFTLSDDGTCTGIGVMNADGSGLRVYKHRGP